MYAHTMDGTEEHYFAVCACGQRADYIDGDGYTCGECLDGALEQEAEDAAIDAWANEGGQ